VSALHPPFWRVSDPRNYQCARAAGAAVSYVLMDSYADYDPRPTPWKDWPGWEGHIRRVLSVAQARGATVDFWEPWNEPWAPAANAPLALAAFARANAVIRQAAPGAKIVAPSLAQWNERALERFFDDAVAKGQTYDAVSWHEFGEPEELSGHAARTRALLAARPSLGRPEIHVNEYATEDQHLVPAYAVAWFAALEAADVQWASRACWDGYENGRTWSDCWRGLDGLFLRDGVSRQALYWVFRGYAAMSGRRLVVAGTSAGGGASRTVALAARDDVKNEIRVLVGRYQRIVRGEVPPVTLADVTVRLTGLAPALPQASVRVERIAYQRVSGHPNAVQPLAAPQVVAPRRLPVRGGVLSIDLPALPDYEVASIVVSEQ
jgi:hypothetical protein